jgi:hypothetical protein
MKKYFALAVAVVLIVCTLAACGGSAKEVVLKDIMNDINSKYGISDLKVLESASDLNRYYNIAEEDVKQFAAELTTAASQYNEVILVEAVDADAAGRVATMLNNHLDAQVNTAKSYDQDTLAMVESCKVVTKGNIVYLVIGDKADEKNKDIDAAL